MRENKLSEPALCHALMSFLVETIYMFAQGKADLVRRGARNAIEEDMGRSVLRLRSALQTEEEIAALEMSLREVQEDILGVLFALVDGSTKPSGWPDKLQLVNMDTNGIVCGEEGLEWAFGEALADYRARLDDGGEA